MLTPGPPRPPSAENGDFGEREELFLTMSSGPASTSSATDVASLEEAVNAQVCQFNVQLMVLVAR